ncbi:hypothetical protein ACFYWY_37330 [Streptomyces sp. NPDC002870]|uniref:hypothetical protein n=1 Tax=Streptomyces sp. NPDC002870 TaxID=3364666 RepID=UPI00368F409F
MARSLERARESVGNRAMSFDIEIVCAPHESDQRLVAYTTEPDPPTAHVLRILASWNAAHRR